MSGLPTKTELNVRTHGALAGIGDTLKEKFPRCEIRYGHIPEGTPFMEVDCGPTDGSYEERLVVLDYEDEGAGFGILGGDTDYRVRPDEVWLEPHEVVASMSRWLVGLK